MSFNILLFLALFTLFSLNGNSYLAYLEKNGFGEIATIIKELAAINNENIKLKDYNEKKVTKALTNFTADYQAELIEKIEKEYFNETKIDFNNKTIENCFLKGIIINNKLENFSVSSDNHTSLDLFTNTLNEEYHIYLGDTIDKQREFSNKETLEKLSLVLLFTHITKGLFENIINKGKNAIYCAGNHDIGKVFNHDKFISDPNKNNKIIDFLKKAIRLTNFTECVVITNDTFIEFKHGNGKNTFENIETIHQDKNILITLSKNSKTVYQNILSKEAKNYLNNNNYDGVKDVTAPYDISSNWGHIPAQPNQKNDRENENLKIFKEITNADIQQNGLEKTNAQKNYIQFFGHFHGALCNFDDYYLNQKKTTISPYIKTYTYSDTSFLSVFMPPSYHDNNFLKSKNMASYLKNNEFIIDIRYHFSLSKMKTTFFIKEEKKENEKDKMKKILPQNKNYPKKFSFIGFILGAGIGRGFIAFSKKNPKLTQHKFFGKKLLLTSSIIGAAAGYAYGRYHQTASNQK